MKIKSLVLLSSLCLLFACGGGSTTSETSSSSQPTSQISQEEAFTLFTDAITFKTNDRFTGYRLNVYIRSIETKEQVYSLNRNVSMDKTNNACEYTETVTRINDDINSDGDTITETKHMYYTNGSIIVEGNDGRYSEKDGIITQSTGLTKFVPTQEAFEDLVLNVRGNTLDMEGKIVPSKANELFSTTGLENITNATMEAEIYDDILEEVSWKYDLDGLSITQSLSIAYDNFVVTPPAL